jgi:hypothetical protein
LGLFGKKGKKKVLKKFVKAGKKYLSLQPLCEKAGRTPDRGSSLRD